MVDTVNIRASIGARRNPKTETAVLQAAADLIREQVYGAVTMEAVCKRARAAKATLYRWWPSKAHLVLALVSRAKQEMVLPETGSLRGDLNAYFEDLLARWRGDSGAMPLGALVRFSMSRRRTMPNLAPRCWKNAATDGTCWTLS